MTFVLDCSVAISWCFEDEASPETDRILDMVAKDGAFVPNLWHLEITNVLIQAEKRGRISKQSIRQRLDAFSVLPITVDNETHHKAFDDVLHFAVDHKLTSYDAAYLELAVRRKLPLATKDKALKKTARKIGLSVMT